MGFKKYKKVLFSISFFSLGIILLILATKGLADVSVKHINAVPWVGLSLIIIGLLVLVPNVTFSPVKRWFKGNRRIVWSALLPLIIGTILLTLATKGRADVPVKHINVVLWVGLALIIIGAVGPICMCSGYSWVIPSLIVFAIILTILITTIYNNQVTSSATDGQNLLMIALTGLAIIVALVGILFGRKIEKLFDMERRLDDVSQMTVTSAELVFSILPDFTESHQIPERSYETLNNICEPVFKSGSLILEYLDKVGNGATLRYAKSLKSFAEDDYTGARDTLKEALKSKKIKPEIKNVVLYRLGIVYRQLNQYRDSIECFKHLYKNAGDNDRERIQAKYGAALTLHAIYEDNKEKYWTRDKLKKQMEDNISEMLGSSPQLGNRALYNNYALQLIDEVIKGQPNNYSAILYQAKIYFLNDNNDNKKSSGNMPNNKEKQIRKNLDEILLKFLKRNMPESLNILANYLVVEALSYLYLGGTENKKEAQKALEHACKTIYEYKRKKGCSATIFSDMKVRQLLVDDFKKEIDEIKTK